MDPADRERAILSLTRTVGYLAWKFSRRFGVEFDDLVGVAWQGAIRAVDDYDPDPARPAALASYATWRIRGALLDWAREQDYLTRQTRARVKAGTLPGMAPALSLNFELETRPALLDTLPSEHGQWDPEAVALADLMEEPLHQALEGLPDRERWVVCRVDLQGATMKDVGAELGVTESRVSQIRKAALERLRAALS